MSKKAKTTPKEELPKGFLLKGVNGSEWEIKQIIGSGGFGYVYSGLFNYQICNIIYVLTF